MVTYLLPEEVQQKIRCGYCSNLLSAGIVTVPNTDEGLHYACGRCSKTNGSSTRASAYEAIAAVVKFPCRYSEFGCNRQLAWGRVLDHEKSCDHRTYNCVADNCKWNGISEALKLHIQENHKNIIIKGYINKIPTSDSEFFSVMFAHDELFLVHYRYLNSKFGLIVKYLGKPQDSGRFSYDIVVKPKNGKRPVSQEMYSGKVKAFNDYSSHIDNMDVENTSIELETIFGSSNLKAFIKITEDVPKKEKKVKEVIVDLKNNENNVPKTKNKKEAASTSEIKYKKKEILEKNKENVDSNVQKDPVAPIEKNPTSKSVEVNIMRELECPICQEYIFPPIYLCTLGHSVCNDCKSKLTKCPTCTSEYGNTRNYTLENMLQLINLPCRNENFGCTFVGNITSIQQHKHSCTYDSITCPIPSDCQWKGAVDLLSMHLKSYHKRNIYVKLNEMITHDLNTDETLHNLVQLENKLFRISCKYIKKKNGLMKWSFQKIIPKSSSQDYKIEIEFIDQTANDRKFIIDYLFSDITENTGIFHDALVIPAALLQPYVDNSKLLHFKYKMCQ